MITQEPVIRVGIIDHRHRIAVELHAPFLVDGHGRAGRYEVTRDGQSVILTDANGNIHSRGPEILCVGQQRAPFTLQDVTIGVRFHWERKESQTFRGDLKFLARDDGTIAAVNLVPLEEYLTSVISSEMSPEAPGEFLKAHAIASRSWLAAMLQREQRNVGIPSPRTVQREGELIRWYDREDHDLYDVCADDHCQRYQGIAKAHKEAAASAVRSVRGLFLTYEDKICDARFSKSCGGLTEHYQNCWDETPIPYLQCVPDSVHPFQPLRDEQEADAWIRSSPDVYCNTTDREILRRILPSFDRETHDFFRWTEEYRREELEEILHTKSGLDFGKLTDLVPLQRGPSGRIVRLKIQGSGRTQIVGKELEIRRWLSPSHLYSSAFVVESERDEAGLPRKFTFRGCGWGHGVGLCQIGAARMALEGKPADQILLHYYRGTELQRLYA